MPGMSAPGRFVRVLICALALLLPAALALAQTEAGARPAMSALARLGPGGVSLAEGWRGDAALTIPISRAVPWRVFTLDDPMRVVVDFSELDWSGFDPAALAQSPLVITARAGLFRPGWTRLVVELAKPLAVQSAAMETEDGGAGAHVRIELAATDRASFAAAAGAPESALFAPVPEPSTPALPHERQRGDRPLVVVLDPGHGGIDPGAERGGVREKDLVLAFARELREVLRRAGYKVVLTRDDDRFVPLETRVTIARAARADVFISLHADALAEGRASGTSVYTLSDEASDLASQKLAERHDREDLLAGVDLSGQGDEVALVLMDLARTETQPRAEKLADALVEGIYAATGSAYKTPRLHAGFSVLKAPDIPSVLIELGFLSSARDRENLTSPAWRKAAAEGIRDALGYWAIEDAAEAELLRQ